MADKKALSAEGYEQAPEYLKHVEEVLASYEHPKGLLGELVAQLADAFWWIKVYRRDKEKLILLHMTSILVNKRDIFAQNQQPWLATFETLSEFMGRYGP